MRWHDAHSVVEELRSDTRLYLPALSKRRGFSSPRVEHLLNGLVRKLPQGECYFEVGTLEGRTLEAAAAGNDTKTIIGCDPCEKYDILPEGFGSNVIFVVSTWQQVLKNWEFPNPIGCAFYDGDHGPEETAAFMRISEDFLADEAVVVLDDWDRQTVRDGAFRSSHRWRLLREMPEYTDGLTTAQHHFGYSFGIAIWGFKRG